MKLRTFLKGVAVLGASALAGSCISRVSQAAKDETQGTPYRCERCGYLTRSDQDLTQTRCPRCRSKQFKKISEAEMEHALNPDGSNA